MYDNKPSYFCYAGLVFTPLTQPHLHESGEDWFNTAPRRLVDKALNANRQREGQQVVILSQVLVDEVNAGFQNFADLEVLKVDGRRVDNLRHLRWLVDNCRGRFLRFDLDDGRVVVLDREQAEVAHRRILELHQVPAAMSQDLLEEYTPPPQAEEEAPGEGGKKGGGAEDGGGAALAGAAAAAAAGRGAAAAGMSGRHS